MTFARSMTKTNAIPTVMQSQQGGALQGYGTSEGVEKGWQKRARARQRDVMWHRKDPGVRMTKRDQATKGRVKIGHNMSTLNYSTKGRPSEIFYSYDTPVAVMTPKGVHVTTQKFSNTTSKQITKYLRMKGWPKTKSARQAAISKLADWATKMKFSVD